MIEDNKENKAVKQFKAGKNNAEKTQKISLALNSQS